MRDEGIHSCLMQVTQPFFLFHFATLAIVLIMLTPTQQVLLSISNVQSGLLCLPRFRPPQSVVQATSPSRMNALVLW